MVEATGFSQVHKGHHNNFGLHGGDRDPGELSGCVTFLVDSVIIPAPLFEVKHIAKSDSNLTF